VYPWCAAGVPWGCRNRAATEIYGWAEEEALGQNILSVLRAANQSLHDMGPEVIQALIKGQRWQGEWAILTKHDKAVTVMVRMQGALGWGLRAKGHGAGGTQQRAALAGRIDYLNKNDKAATLMVRMQGARGTGLRGTGQSGGIIRACLRGEFERGYVACAVCDLAGSGHPCDG